MVLQIQSPVLAPLEIEEASFPSNIVVLATHGSHYIPDEWRDRISAELREVNERGVKNYSDYGSGWIVSGLATPEQRVVVGFSRMLGDPNRSPDAADLFREVDFAGNPVWKVPPTEEEKEVLFNTWYRKYHDAVLAAIQTAESKHDRVIVFDVHDTGNLMLAPDPNNDTERAESFPAICLGDKDGESCDPEIMADFARLIEKHLGMTPYINHPYKGGYVTEKYGQAHNNALPDHEKFQRNVIQVELGRYLYMDEKTQEIDHVKLARIQAGLNAAMKELGELYSK